MSTSSASTAGARRVGSRPGALPLLLYAAIVLVLCTVVALVLYLVDWSPELPTEYGHRTGPAAESVNGTSVLADMFKSAGHTVSGATWAGPKLSERADVIVWFPNDVAPPSSEERRWFETWLKEEPDRTLVYVGRDFDAAPQYWSYVAEHSKGDEQAAAREQLRLAHNLFTARRLSMPERADCRWFTATRALDHRTVRQLSGDREWMAGVDAAKLGIELYGRLSPARRWTRLLYSAKDVLVSRKQVGASQILLVANGSFLLNLPLVNHEHRKLAGKLIDAVGDEQQVVFLESGPEGLTIYEKDPEPPSRSGLAILVTEPFDIPILHLAVAGIVFCLARFPIFGRPRQWEPGELSDFAAHITALGKLLALTRDRVFAQTTLANYQRAVHASSALNRLAPGPVVESTPSNAGQTP